MVCLNFGVQGFASNSSLTAGKVKEFGTNSLFFFTKASIPRVKGKWII